MNWSLVLLLTTFLVVTFASVWSMPTPGKVKVDVVYSINSNASRNFLSSVLKPFVVNNSNSFPTDWSKIIDIELVAVDRSMMMNKTNDEEEEEDEDDENGLSRCRFELDECQIDKLQMCAVNEESIDSSSVVRFVVCVAEHPGAVGNNLQVSRECAKQFLSKNVWSSIEKCANSTESDNEDDVYSKVAEKMKNLQPPVQELPYVSVNGMFDERASWDLLTAVCNAFEGKPPAKCQDIAFFIVRSNNSIRLAELKSADTTITLDSDDSFTTEKSEDKRRTTDETEASGEGDDEKEDAEEEKTTVVVMIEGSEIGTEVREADEEVEGENGKSGEKNEERNKEETPKIKEESISTEEMEREKESEEENKKEITEEKEESGEKEENIEKEEKEVVGEKEDSDKDRTANEDEKASKDDEESEESEDEGSNEDEKEEEMTTTTTTPKPTPMARPSTRTPATKKPFKPKFGAKPVSASMPKSWSHHLLGIAVCFNFILFPLNSHSII